jgi:hypothetical protein
MKKMVDEAIPEISELATEAFNKRVASLLSLKPNKPDDKGKSRIQQERDRLERDRLLWEHTNSLQVDKRVIIPVGTPVGLGTVGSYITQKPMEGILKITSGHYGGSGYMEHGTKRLYPLFTVSVEVPHGKEVSVEKVEQVNLLVPNDMLKTALQASTDNSLNDQIAA